MTMTMPLPIMRSTMEAPPAAASAIAIARASDPRRRRRTARARANDVSSFRGANRSREIDACLTSSRALAAHRARGVASATPRRHAVAARIAVVGGSPPGREPARVRVARGRPPAPAETFFRARGAATWRWRSGPERGSKDRRSRGSTGGVVFFPVRADDTTHRATAAPGGRGRIALARRSREGSRA
jgi:hypothetical protein